MIYFKEGYGCNYKSQRDYSLNLVVEFSFLQQSLLSEFEWKFIIKIKESNAIHGVFLKLHTLKRIL